MSNELVRFALCALLAYLLGSIPFGLILTRCAGVGDIRRIGSGNIGATNVLRTGRKGLAAATMLLDGGKGAVAVLLARRYGSDMAALAAVFATVGHIYPVWLRFSGGKGVATSAGALIAYQWPVGLACGATWLAAALVTRYSSLAAMIAALLAPLYVWLFTREALPTATAFVIALLVLERHRGNALRLVRGEESRMKFGKKYS
jgi:acyl phosphate:glycerol-3-phosphate acyltransferase